LEERDLNQTNTKITKLQFQRNALHWAALRGAPDDIIKALIDAGVDPKAKNDYGKTPADIARHSKHPATASFIEQYGMAPIKSANLMV
jgi:ankyrin repeat protein